MGTDEGRRKSKQQTTLSLVYNITADDVETPKNEKEGGKRGKTINENTRKRDESVKFRTNAKFRAFVCAVPVRDTLEDLLESKLRHFRGPYLVAISLRGGCVHVFRYQCLSLYIADLQFDVERDASRKVPRTDASWFLVSPCWCRLGPSTLSLLDVLRSNLQS